MMMMMPSITAHCQDACNVGDEGGCTLGGISTTATREWLSVILLGVWNYSSNRIDLPWFIHPIVLENMGFGNKNISRGTLKPSRLDAEDLHQASKTTTRPSPSKCSEHLGANSRKTDWNTWLVWWVVYLVWPGFIFWTENGRATGWSPSTT